MSSILDDAVFVDRSALFVQNNYDMVYVDRPIKEVLDAAIEEYFQIVERPLAARSEVVYAEDLSAFEARMHHILSDDEAVLEIAAFHKREIEHKEKKKKEKEKKGRTLVRNFIENKVPEAARMRRLKEKYQNELLSIVGKEKKKKQDSMLTEFAWESYCRDVSGGERSRKNPWHVVNVIPACRKCVDVTDDDLRDWYNRTYPKVAPVKEDDDSFVFGGQEDIVVAARPAQEKKKKEYARALGSSLDPHRNLGDTKKWYAENASLVSHNRMLGRPLRTPWVRHAPTVPRLVVPIPKCSKERLEAQGPKGIFDSIRDAPNMVEAITHCMDQHVPSLTSAATRLSEDIRAGTRTIADATNNLTNNARSIWGSMLKVSTDMKLGALRFLKGMIKYAPIILGLWYLVHLGSSLIDRPMLVALCKAGEFFCGAGLGYIITKHILSFLEDDSPKPQVGLGCIEGSGKFISALFTWCTFKKGCPVISFDDLNRRMADFSRASDGWDSFILWVSSCFEKFCEFANEKLGYECFKASENSVRKAETWMREVSLFLSKCVFAEKQLVSDDAARIKNYIVAGEILFAGNKMSPNVTRLFERKLQLLQRIVEDNRAVFSRLKGERPEPVCVAITGPPGCGKSLLTKTLISCILAEAMPEEVERRGNDLDSTIYSHDGGDYWPGYSDQKVLVMDDWMQANAVAGQTNCDALTLIRAVNSWQWPLPMADLFSKGATFFRSPLVVLTTNLVSLKACSGVVADVGALNRRMHYQLRIEPHPDYAIQHLGGTTTFNEEKYHADSKEAGHPIWSAWRVYGYSFIAGRPCTDGAKIKADKEGAVDLEALIDHISSELVRRNKGKESSDAALLLYASEKARRKLGTPSLPSGKKLLLKQHAIPEAEVVPAPSLKAETNSLSDFHDAKSECADYTDEQIREHVRADMERENPNPPVILEVVREFCEMEELEAEKKRLKSLWEEWGFVIKSGILVMVGTVVVVALKKVCKWLFPAVGVDKYKTPHQRNASLVNTWLVNTDERVKVAAAKVARELGKDDLREDGEFKPDSLIDYAVARAQSYDISTSFKERSSNTRKQKFDRYKRTGTVGLHGQCTLDYMSPRNLAIETEWMFRTMSVDEVFEAWMDSMDYEAMVPDDHYYLWAFKVAMKEKRAGATEEQNKRSIISKMEELSLSDTTSRYIGYSRRVYEKNPHIKAEEVYVGFLEQLIAETEKFPVSGKFEEKAKKVALEELRNCKKFIMESKGYGYSDFSKFLSWLYLPGTSKAECTVQASWDVLEAVSRNCFRFSIYSPKTKKHRTLGVLTFVRGRHAIYPRHFDSALQTVIDMGGVDDFEIELVSTVDKKLSVRNMTLSDWMRLKKVNDGTDISVVEMPLTSPAGRDIVNKFMTLTDYENTRFARICVDRMRLDPVTNKVTSQPIWLDAEADHGQSYPEGNNIFTVDYTYAYRKSPTESGDCGCPIIVGDNTALGARVFAGIHVAGTNNMTGYCFVPTQERIKKLLALLPDGLISQSWGPELDLTEHYGECGLGSMSKLGTVARGLSMANKTQLRRTVLHNAWGPQAKLPARLCPFAKLTPGGIVTIDPMANALSSYTGDIVYINEMKLERAVHEAFKKIVELTQKNTRKIYSFEQAVAGDPYTPYATGITRGTSPGYPFNTQGHKNKRAFFGAGDEYEFDNELARGLRDRVEHIISEAKQGRRCLHIYSDLLKDELRGIERVVVGKTRLISASPMDYTIAWRMYFLAFQCAVQDTRVDNSIAIGMNPYKEWETLSRKLTRYSSHMVAGDYSGYDGSEVPQVHLALLDKINQWYDDGPENALVRRVLFMEVYDSFHIGGLGGARNQIIKWSKGLPSGHPATSIINSLYNITILALAFYDTTEGTGFDFWSHVYPIVYGDDNVLSVSDEVLDKFNQMTIEETVPRYGMKYTPECKEGSSIVPSRPITEVSFLKRGFVRRDRVWMCPLDVESIVYRPYWTKDANREKEILLDVLEEVLEELSMHDDDLFQEWAKVITKKASALLPWSPKLPINRAVFYREKVLNSDHNW